MADESKTPLYPFAGLLGNGLRAAGDVRFAMHVSISLTIGARSSCGDCGRRSGRSFR